MKYRLALMITGSALASMGIVLHSADRVDAIYAMLTLWGMAMAGGAGLWWFIDSQEGS